MSGIVFGAMSGVKKLMYVHAVITCPTLAFEASRIIGTNQLKIKPPRLHVKEAGMGRGVSKSGQNSLFAQSIGIHNWFVDHR